MSTTFMSNKCCVTLYIMTVVSVNEEGLVYVVYGTDSVVTLYLNICFICLFTCNFSEDMSFVELMPSETHFNNLQRLTVPSAI